MAGHGPAPTPRARHGNFRNGRPARGMHPHPRPLLAQAPPGLNPALSIAVLADYRESRQFAPKSRNRQLSLFVKLTRMLKRSPIRAAQPDHPRETGIPRRPIQSIWHLLWPPGGSHEKYACFQVLGRSVKKPPPKSENTPPPFGGGPGFPRVLRSVKNNQCQRRFYAPCLPEKSACARVVAFTQRRDSRAITRDA
jgi:hypothetical protein